MGKRIATAVEDAIKLGFELIGIVTGLIQRLAVSLDEFVKSINQ